MSQPNSESSIASSFRELLDYVSILGEHINQIYDRLEKVEENINKIEKEVEASITDNRNELESIKKAIITKSEFNDILEELYEPFKEFSPPKTIEGP